MSSHQDRCEVEAAKSSNQIILRVKINIYYLIICIRSNNKQTTKIIDRCSASKSNDFDGSTSDIVNQKIWLTVSTKIFSLVCSFATVKKSLDALFNFCVVRTNFKF